MRSLGRGPVVLGLLVLGLLVVAVATRPWVSAVAPTPGAGTQAVVGTGSAVTPVGALGLVVMAAAGALLLARRFVVVVLAAVALLAAGGAAWSALQVLADPLGAAVPVVARAAGLTEASVRADEVQADATGWAVAGLVLALLAGLLAGAALVGGRGWEASRRHERTDTLPDGETIAGPTAGADGTGRPVGTDEPSRADEVAHDWDALSRGEDPTARG